MGWFDEGGGLVTTFEARERTAINHFLENVKTNEVGENKEV